MRAAAYVLAALVTLPYAGLALAFILLGRVIAAGSWSGFFGTLLTLFIWLVPWGLLAMALGGVVLVAAGISPAWRKGGAVVVCLLAVASITTINCLSSTRLGVGEWAFLLPCLVSAAVTAWLVLTEGGAYSPLPSPT